jgi:hypothetical protein
MENDLRLKESKGDSSLLRESVLEFQKNIMENDLRLKESKGVSSLLREPQYSNFKKTS